MSSVTDLVAESPREPAAEACRNCGAPAPGQYCPSCGQETRVALPAFGASMRDAAGRYVALDGRLWRTLYALVARPGYLTLEYLNGRRKRYIRPARLFLVLYLLLFAVIGLVQSPRIVSQHVVFDSEATQAKQAMQEAVREDEEMTEFVRRLELGLGLGSQSRFAAPLVERWNHFKALPGTEQTERLYAGALRYGPYAVVMLLPAFALLMKLAYLGRSRRYPGRPRKYAEHLVYSAHVHAFAAIMILALLLVPFTAARLALVAWIFFYAMRARQLVYRGRWWGGLLRALAVATVYSMLLALAIVGLLVAAVLLS